MNDFTHEKWDAMSMAELYEGAEWVTTPSASALISQAGLASPGVTARDVKVLDIGCGLGQVSQMLYAGKQGWEGEVTLGEIDPSLVQACKAKVEREGWQGAVVRNLDAMHLDLPDNTFSHVLANFVVMLLPRPIDALKESIRVLQPGGTLGLTTWDICGPRNLLQHAQALIPEAPNTRTVEISGMQMANGYWHDRGFIRQTLESLGLTDIKIEGFNHRQEAASARECAYDMRIVTKLTTRMWSDQSAAWKMFEKMEEVLKGEYGDGKVGMWSVALIVTAKKPL